MRQSAIEVNPRQYARFRVLGNPAPLARAVDGDRTGPRRAER
jgi:hypothetical protein